MKLSESKIFNLEKLYFDCIDDDGNCFILYWAKLEIYFFRFYYSGLVFSDYKNVITKKSVFKKTSRPLIAKLLSIDNPLLQIKGNWKKTDNSITQSLFQDEKNRELIWNCHHPKALTEIKYNNRTFKGLGYSETLSLPIKPWNLPFEELKWGRFLSDQYTIIWILWKGKNPLNKIWCNGVEYNDAFFLVDRIIFNRESFVLLFNNISTLKNGKIVNILSKLNILRFIIKRCILHGYEFKYKAKITLNKNGKVVACGWSLYETVIWKK